MKYSRFWIIISLLLPCVAWIFSSCAKSPKINISTKQVIFEAYPEENITVDISSNVHWDAKLIQNDNDRWLYFVDEELITPNSIQGKGNGKIVLKASDNMLFDGRSAFVVISGDEVRTDTIYVAQSGSVDISEIIEDEEFRKYCLAEFDKSPKDGKLSLLEVRNANKITVTGLKINSLVGIEYFTGLKELFCANNNIPTINLNKNKSLLKLDCSYNPIDNIEIGELTELTDFTIDHTKIKTMDVSKNVKLERLYASNNQLTIIDVSNNIELEWLYLDVNLLGNIELKKNTKLTILSCSDNQLSTIDISNNKNLVRLWCNNNQLNNLNITQNPTLQFFSCSQNNITKLDLNGNMDLERLYCDRNQIETLDVSRNTKLTDLRCTSNKLTNLNLIYNKYLEILYFSNNKLSNLDVSHNLALQRLNCDLNNLTSLDLTNNTELIELFCYGNQLGTLHLDTNTKLIDLRCYNCGLNNHIDISNNKSLTTLQIQNNPLPFEIWVWKGFNKNSTKYQKDTDAKYVEK